ncbi:MAG: hypothetical protein ABIK65_07010 [Candidatus Eisenbacteria bacterium]
MKQGKAAIGLLFLLHGGAAAAHGMEWGENHPGADWREVTTDHFRVIAPAAHARTAARAAAIAEEAFGPVTFLVGGAPPRRIDIILRDWDDRSGGRSYSSFPRIEIEPYPLDRENAEIDFLRQVVVHEFTHVAMYYAVGGERLEALRAPAALLNLPDWWVEGLPSALEKPRTEPREMDFVRMIARSDEIPRRHRLDDIDQGDRYDDILIYWVGESMVRWIIDRFGAGAVAEIHAAMRPIPWSFHRALKRVTGMSEGEIYDAWKTDLLAAIAEEESPPEPLESHPLPDWLERPLTFAYSGNGDLAIVAVRDEDVYWPELYVQWEGEGEPELIDPGPVWPKVSWNGDGTKLVYSRLVPGPSGADQYDVFSFDGRTGRVYRLTSGMRAAYPQVRPWTPEKPVVVSIAYRESTGTTSPLLLEACPGGRSRVFTPPDATGILRDPDPLEGFAMTELSLDHHNELYLFISSFRDETYVGGKYPLPGISSLRDPEEIREYRRINEEFLKRSAVEGPRFDPLPARREGLIYDSPLYIAYRGEVPTFVWEHNEPERIDDQLYYRLPGYVRDPFPKSDSEIPAVTASGRYRSRIARLDLSEPIDLPPSGKILWHQKPVIENTPRGIVPEGGFPTEGYSTLANIRPRPVAVVNTVDTDGFDASLEDLLADPTNRHNLDVDGAARWDREGWNVLGTYRNRQLLPTIYLLGGYGEAKGTAGGERWGEVAKRAALTLRLPFRAESYYERYVLSCGLTHLRSARTENLGPEIDRRETMGFLRIAREVNRPRRNTLLALRYERGVDLFSPAVLPERFELDTRFSHAIFRNDGFLSFNLSGDIETAAEKRALLLLPPNITAPLEPATGTRTVLYGAGFAYPWSEDLALPLGPITFERLTHRIEYREGRAWTDDDRETIVRSAWTELDLRLFSARLFPFSGANILHLRAGVAHELADGADSEFYFAISSDFWNERWTGSAAGEGETDSFRGRRSKPRPPPTRPPYM